MGPPGDRFRDGIDGISDSSCGGAVCSTGMRVAAVLSDANANDVVLRLLGKSDRRIERGGVDAEDGRFGTELSSDDRRRACITACMHEYGLHTQASQACVGYRCRT